ncbi:hypothetical protein [Paenibacillus faecalis]|uniref:hypothetical protein n=1 Tax=Paenibacillus faecalis TaxID=2079532 RepID=UPI000D10A018|nr:hypothetical protein [Paenibacillus faecalis]
MNKGIILIAACACALSLLFGFRVPAASALSCAGPKPVTEEIERSTITFKGTLISESSDSLTFQVSTWWKGDPSQTTVTLKANIWVVFEPGKEYIVFAGKQNGKLTPNLCGNTGPSSMVDMTDLGPGTPVLPTPDLKNTALGATPLGTIISTILSLLNLFHGRLL